MLSHDSCVKGITATLLVTLPLALNSLNSSAQVQTDGIHFVSIKNRQAEASQLFRQGVEQFRSGQFQSALQTYQQVLTIRKALNDQAGVAQTLNNIGEVYTGLSEYGKAVDFLQQALTIRKGLDDQAGVGETLNNIGFVYRQLADYPQALVLHQQALEIAKKIGNRQVEGEAVHNIAAVYAAQGEYNKALLLYQQAFLIRQQVGDKRDEGRTLNNLAGVYSSLGEYNQALASYQQALAIRQTLNDKAGVGRILSNIGLIYRQQGQYSQALKYYQQALPMLQAIGDQASVGNTLNGIGLIYESQGQYAKALETYQQSLEIARQIGDKAGVGKTLDNIGGIHYSQGRYSPALSSYQQALEIRRQIGDKTGVGNSLNNLGGVYYSLGQYPQALEFLQQALVIRQEIGDKAGIGRVKDAIAVVYESLKQYPQALEYAQQALAIAKQVGDKAGEGESLDHIGAIYTSLGKYSQSQAFLQQALVVRQAIGDQAGEGRTLNSIAGVYYSLHQYPQALESLQQALSILEDVGDQASVGIITGNIGHLLEQQNLKELAIVFYKQSVNATESIRKDLKVLSLAQQQSFTTTVAGTYRALADLLLQQNRVLEAQRVLDLLKVQELAEYLRNMRGNEQTAQGIELLPQEQQISEKHTHAVQLGKELAQLHRIPESQRTTNQQQRTLALEKLQQQQRTEFNEFIRSPDVIAIVQQLNRTTGGQNIVLPNLNRLQRNLQQLPQPTVLLYPLVLEDRIELVLATPNSVPIHRSVPVRRQDLNRAIAEFREALLEPSADAKKPGRQLYDWLIKPIENDLVQANAKNIIYAPDGELRYIPLAALYDGKQWLVERFAINNITAATLTDLFPAPRNQPHVLAAAFTKGSYNVTLGNRQIVLAGLTFAGREVEDLAATIKNTTKLLDAAFSPKAVVPHLNDYNIVHLATHAAFVIGQPEESFILFGDGNRVTLRDVETWNLPNVDLVVLSACETGLGGQLGNGEEILGFGYQMQQTGARASIASLWTVDDGGTQALMDAFYAALEKGEITKTEALRQAQIALITDDYKALGEQRGIAVQERTRNSLPPKVKSRLSHPYYWAPFILIGNGL